MKRINEYAPNLTEKALEKMDGFTVLAHTKEAAMKEILLGCDREDFTDIELVGSWDMSDWETQDRLEMQDYY